MSDLDPYGLVMRQSKQLLQHAKEHIAELPGDESEQVEVHADLTKLFSTFPDHVEGFKTAFKNLVQERRKLMDDMQRLA